MTLTPNRTLLFKIIFLLCTGYFLSCTADQREDPASVLPQSAEINPVNLAAIPSGTATLALTHCRIVVGDGHTVIPDGTVVVSGDRITEAGSFADVAVPEEAEVLDASGTTLLPGLIDAHFHLDRIDSLPSLFLSHGVTSLRDPGAWIEAYDGERASGRNLPRLYLTGPHIDMFPPAYPNDSYLVRDPLEARAAVNRFADQGSTAIKIYFRSSLEIIREVCQTAKERGLPVTAHLEVTDIYEAVENGINGIEHITSLGTTLTPARTAEAYKQRIFHDNDARRAGRYEMWQAIGPESEPATRLGQFLAEQHIFLCPTLGAFEYRASPESVDTVRLEGFQNMMAYTKKLYDLGVPIVLGSHSWVRYAEKGWAYHHEMELLEQLGMPPLEIIRSATLRNAEFFRIADKTGTIEKGKQADLILVEGDPLSNIKVMRQLRAVMLAGRWIEGPGL